MGSGTVLGALADVLAATLNPNVGGGDRVAPLLEGQGIDWMRETTGVPAGASGLLVSGGSVANFVAPAVAGGVNPGFDVREVGMHAAPAAAGGSQPGRAGAGADAAEPIALSR